MDSPPGWTAEPSAARCRREGTKARPRGNKIGAVLPNPPVRSIDLAARGITTVIWCTGFRGDFGWPVAD
ncbi:hypothetical protein E0H51_28595 [Rhizobium leguminosarum bv. viciae]|nr:hypothetical protein E0H51_28595 [Rhizobium leguminosarum bv. viciae]